MRVLPRSFVSVKRAVAFLAASLPLSLIPLCGHSQGLGDTVNLHAKVPAIVNLTEPDIEIKVSPTAPGSAALAHGLSAELQTALQQADHRITTDTKHPETRLEVDMISYTPYKVAEVKLGTDTTVKGKVYAAPTGHVVTAGLTIDYRAVSTRTGRPIDAAQIEASIKENYGIPEVKKLCKFCPSLPTGRSLGAVFDKPEPVPDATTVTQKLVGEAAQMIAARLVNTDKDIPVRLAKGKLEEEAKVAATKNWAKMLDDLKAMDPLPDPVSDSYRLYDMGVALEAQGYAVAPAEAAPLFDQAAEQYKAASDAAPFERGYLDPLVRIQTAYVSTKTIVERSKTGNAISAPGVNQTISRDEAKAQGEAKPDSKPDTPSADPNTLTNATIIRYTQKGMDETNLVAMISDAKQFRFDLTPDALDQLLDNKVSNKVIAAMRQKNQAAAAKRSTVSRPGGGHS